MNTTSPAIVQDPRVSSNLNGVTAVAIVCDPAAGRIPGFSIARLKKRVKELLTEEGLAVERRAASTLVISAAVEARPIEQCLIYGVEVALREQVGLPRAADDLQTGIADTWRHQCMSGVIFPPYSLKELGKALRDEALRQTVVFLQDWSRMQGENVDGDDRGGPGPDEEEAPSSTRPSDARLARVREVLGKLLARLAVGDAGKAEITRFEPDGTKVRFEAAVIHRARNRLPFNIGGKYLYSVTTEAQGEFDVADPTSVRSLKVCVKLPPVVGGGKRCVSAGDLEELVSAAAAP